jgi:hypothetical protein
VSIAYPIVIAIGIAFALVVWLAGRARWPLTIARSIGVVIVLGGTGFAVWAVHEGLEAAEAGNAVGDSFVNNVVVH